MIVLNILYVLIKIIYKKKLRTEKRKKKKDNMKKKHICVCIH